MPYLQLPDGRYLTLPEGMSELDAIDYAVKKVPDAYGLPKPKVGYGKKLLTEAQRGGESLLSQGLTGIQSLLGNADEAAQAGIERGEDIQKRLGPSEVGLEALKQAYQDKGISGALSNVAQQIPLVLANQGVNLGATMAGARLGAMAGAAVPLPGAALVGGLAGGALANLPSMFGGNIEEQKQANPNQPVNLGAAGAAAAGQAALESGGQALAAGSTLLRKVLGKEAAALTSKEASEALAKKAAESLTKTVGKGAVRGAAAEIPTEVAQDILQRYQAGEDLTSPDAIKGYGETAFQTALLGGALGTAGRFADKGAAKTELAARQAEQAQQTPTVAPEQQTPESVAPEQPLADYTQDPQAQLDALQEQIASLKGGTKGLTPEQKAERIQQRQALQQQAVELQDQIKAMGPKPYSQMERERIAQEIADQQAKEAITQEFIPTPGKLPQALDARYSGAVDLNPEVVAQTKIADEQARNQAEIEQLSAKLKAEEAQRQERKQNQAAQITPEAQVPVAPTQQPETISTASEAPAAPTAPQLQTPAAIQAQPATTPQAEPITIKQPEATPAKPAVVAQAEPITIKQPEVAPIQPGVRTLTPEGRPVDNQPIKSGDVFQTSSGQVTTPYPKQKGAKYATQWTIDNAVAEAQRRGDDFNAQAFANEKPNKSGVIPPASIASMQEYLFGQQPEVKPSILKPLTTPQQKAAQVPPAATLEALKAEVAPIAEAPKVEPIAPQAAPVEPAPQAQEGINEAVPETKNEVPLSTDHSGRQASWVIKNKATGEVVMETFDRAKVEALNTKKYEAVPIAQHLSSINEQLKALSAPTQESTKESASVEQPAQATQTATAAEAAPESKPLLEHLTGPENDAVKAARESVEQTPPPIQGSLFSNYSRSSPAPVESMGRRGAQIAVNTFKKQFANAPEITVVNKPADIGFAGDEHATAKGVFIPGNKEKGTTSRVFLFSDNLESDVDAKRTLLHEVAGHYGMRGLLGEQFTKTLNNAYLNKTIKNVADKRRADNPNLSFHDSIEEALAEIAEHEIQPKDRGMFRKIIDAIKEQLRKIGLFKTMTDDDVVRLLADSRKFARTTPDTTPTPGGGGNGPMFRKPQTQKPESIVAQRESIVQNLEKFKSPAARAIFAGNLRTNLIDRFAPLESLSKELSENEAGQLMYNLRIADQALNLTNEAITNGALDLVTKTRKDGTTEVLVQSKPGASLKKVYEALGDLKQLGKPNDIGQAFTEWGALRRGDALGIDRLFGGNKELEAQTRQRVAQYEADPQVKAAFEKAAIIYQEYNKGLVGFLQKTGAISKETEAAYLKNGAYIPFYRTTPKGDVIMELGNNINVNVGNINKNQELEALKGGKDQILNFFDSSVRNTAVLTSMGLRNMATRSVVDSLGALKLGVVTANTSGPNVIKYRDNGVMKSFVIDNDLIDEKSGVTAETIVRGLEGVKVPLPVMMRMLAAPAKFLRLMVTRNPAYMGRQVVRDSVSSYILSGSDATPIISTLQQIAKGASSPTAALMSQRGITGGHVFTGAPGDVGALIGQLKIGKLGLSSLLAKLDQVSMRADAANREAAYESFIKQGLSERDATLSALEMANFSRRGLSPSLYMLSQTIPFLNAQIQSLDVLYRSIKGTAPFSDQVKGRQKLMKRATLMAASTMAYALMMQDDEAYKNARPEERLGNWFVPIPFSDEPLRIPIPFEIGFLAKALPEAMINAASDDPNVSDVVSGLAKLSAQSVPGGANIPVPQAIKPMLELSLNRSMYTGKDIVPGSLQGLPASEQAMASTSEMAKVLGGLIDVSPIKIDYFIRSYGAGTAMALVTTMNPILSDTVKPSARASETPLIGSLFQPKEGRGIVENAFEIVQSAQSAQAAINRAMVENPERVPELLEKYKLDLQMAKPSGAYRQRMGELAKQKRLIQAADADADTKREQLNAIDHQISEMARSLLQVKQAANESE